MLKQPVFHPLHAKKIVEQEGVFFISEQGSSFLPGNACAQVAELIDGVRTTEQLVDLLSGSLHAAEVYYAVLQMEKSGYLMEAMPDVPAGLAAFLSTITDDVATGFRRLQETSVAIHAIGGLNAGLLAEKLQPLSLRVAEDGDFDVVLTDDYLREELHDFNERHLQSGRPWLLAKPVGSALWIGPVFRPQESGCWMCLAQRLRAHRAAELTLQQSPPIWTPPALSHAAYELIALEIAKAIVLREPLEVTSLEWPALQAGKHALVRRPQCPACGDDAYFFNHHAPLALSSQAKRAGFRTVSPEETFRAFQHHISPITGIVRKVEPCFPSSEGISIHNFEAGINHAVQPQPGSHESVRRHLRSKSGGKGATEQQARAGALCEAIERYSARYHGDEVQRRASFAELGASAIHPNDWLLFSEAQYSKREEWNRSLLLPGHRVPEPFDEKRVIDWTPVWSMTEQAFRYLPTAVCYFGSPNADFAQADSNGCAAGNTLEEAILQGFLEVIERDSVAVWWYNRLSRGGVDLESFGLPYVEQLQRYYRSLNRDLWVLDITHDFGIPSFVAVSRAVDQPMEKLLCGFGAHLDPETALVRALTEMNQFLPDLSAFERGDQVHPTTARWWKTATLDNQPHLKPTPGQPLKKASSFPRVQHEDLLDDVLYCKALAEERGLELLVLNQTRPDIGLPVAKVIVPGLRHFWNRFAGGRLYEVPVRMGWLPEARKEDELNSIPLFF